MNRNNFLQFVEKPSAVPASAAKDLEEISKAFPWFQGARILLAKALKNGNDIGFPEALKDAALHAGSRRHLYAFINDTNSLDQGPKEDQHGTTAEPNRARLSEIKESGTKHVNPTELIPEKKEQEKAPIELAEAQAERRSGEQLRSFAEPQRPAEESYPAAEQDVIPSLVTALEVKSERSFFEWLKELNTDGQQNAGGKKGGGNENREAKENSSGKEQLIERFMQAEPRISKPEKTEFFSPINMAKKSLEDREDIVSETLATIFAAQGETKRAIRIYQKLSLLNPEKSAYFAALIKKLENASEL